MAALYWYNDGTQPDTEWTTPDNWWSDSSHGTPAGSTPTNGDEVYILNCTNAPTNAGGLTGVVLNRLDMYSGQSMTLGSGIMSYITFYTGANVYLSGTTQWTDTSNTLFSTIVLNDAIMSGCTVTCFSAIDLLNGGTIFGGTITADVNANHGSVATIYGGFSITGNVALDTNASLMDGTVTGNVTAHGYSAICPSTSLYVSGDVTLNDYSSFSSGYSGATTIGGNLRLWNNSSIAFSGSINVNTWSAFFYGASYISGGTLYADTNIDFYNSSSNQGGSITSPVTFHDATSMSSGASSSSTTFTDQSAFNGGSVTGSIAVGTYVNTNGYGSVNGVPFNNNQAVSLITGKDCYAANGVTLLGATNQYVFAPKILSGATVTVDGVTCSGLAIDYPTQFRVNMPSRSTAGDKSLVVSNPDGTYFSGVVTYYDSSPPSGGGIRFTPAMTGGMC